MLHWIGSWPGDRLAMTLTPTTPLRADGPSILLGFARVLRAAGLPVSADREQAFLRAAAEVGLGSREGVYWAGRATMCGSPEDLSRYDRGYAAWFGGERGVRSAPSPMQSVTLQAELAADQGGATEAGSDRQMRVHAVASDLDILRSRDIAEMSAGERARLARLFATLRPVAPRRRARRHTRSRRGRVDARATLREQLRRMGEPGTVRWRRRGLRSRRVVLLVDVSGSMSAYADALLRLGHRMLSGGGPVEVFTMGTRLTQVTRALAQRDPDRALAAAGEVVPDWSGGTRLAEALEAFLTRWGRRGLARGAVVVICSDGWERDRPQALGEAVRRLRALAHRVIWVNPHVGRAGYAPVQAGIVAALPHCDALVSGHSIAAFERLLEVIADA